MRYLVISSGNVVSQHTTEWKAMQAAMKLRWKGFDAYVLTYCK